MNVLPAPPFLPARLQPAALLDAFPGIPIRPMHDVVRTVGVGQQDRGEDLLASDGRDGVALVGADAPIGGVSGWDGGFYG